MTRYRNGMVPTSALVQIDGEPYHYTSPKGLAMWHALQRNVLAKYKVKLRITPGWNAYRPFANQTFARNQACAAGNCNSAAVPGFSSHGGTWKDAVYTNGVEVDAMAFDVDNWAEIGEAAFFAEARKVGFLVDGIRAAVAGHREPWHIIVLDPRGAIPASLESEPLKKPAPVQEEEDDDMAALKGAYYTRASDKKTVYMLFNESSGFCVEHSGVGGDYNNPIAQAWDTGAWPKITEAHAVVIKRGLTAVQRTVVNGSLSVDLTGTVDTAVTGSIAADVS
ncbi:hypothetical protein [Microbacterium terrisoli]|uniref:hypothetical protein n=1 Tax=Microbacterium terrisoli TaxID=3242192 RepID=UPI0028064225|nr:hypothetical protein [Microbacterium protaetiae]